MSDQRGGRMDAVRAPVSDEAAKAARRAEIQAELNKLDASKDRSKITVLMQQLSTLNERR